jgi:hypothetical protein
MTRTRLPPTLLRCAGLVLGPAAWALNMQLGQMLPYPECQLHLPLLAMSSWVLAGVAAGAAYVSWHGVADPRPAPEPQAFVRMQSALAGALFAFTLLLQGFSSVMLTGCER